MGYIEINNKNTEKENNVMISDLNKYLNDKNNKLFVLIFMEGCEPCNLTRPEWSKLKNVLSKSFLTIPNISIVSIDKDLVGKIESIKEPSGFPTIRYITDQGNEVENYEDSDIPEKDRTIDSFINWIKLKTGEKNITKSETSGSMSSKNNKKSYFKKTNTKTKKIRKGGKWNGGKWSLKYKKSINCKRPRGFSQRQYCKYGRNKK